MRERATALGGRLEIQSSPGQGTRAVAAVPMTLRGDHFNGDAHNDGAPNEDGRNQDAQ
jgi:signal transduction histidine kinase